MLTVSAKHRVVSIACGVLAASGCGAELDTSGSSGTGNDANAAAGALAPATSTAPRMAPTVGMATAMMQAAMAARAGSGATVGSVVAAAGDAAVGGGAGVGAAGMQALPAAGSGGSLGSAGTHAVAAGGGGMPAAAGSGGMGAVTMESASLGCGADAQLVTGMSRKEGNGNTNLRTSGEVEFVSWKGTMIVPKNPAPPRGTLFLWPGLQPLKMDQTVGYGVLQPVLTWGTSCADMTNTSYDHWWISGVYVGTPPGSWTNISCKAGAPMNVEVTDKLDIEMTLNNTIWMTKMTDRSNGKTVSFDYDLKGQKQQWLLHQIEAQGQTKPVDDVIFTDVVATMSDSQPKSCYPSETGANDYFSPPLASADGKKCCFSKIILRASGIMPSSPNMPMP